LPGLNGGGAAAAVPSTSTYLNIARSWIIAMATLQRNACFSRQRQLSQMTQKLPFSGFATKNYIKLYLPNYITRFGNVP